MFEPDVDGFVYPKGEKVGGHAYAIAGYGWLHGFLRYRIENSWGPRWGDNGGAWIWEYDLLPLLEDDGEMAFPTKVRL
jgi:C1A family cysteine protease